MDLDETPADYRERLFDERPYTREEDMPKTTLDGALVVAVDRLDIDGVLYHLNQIAVARRDDEENANKADREYWRKAQLILSDAQEKLESLNEQ